MSKTTRSFRVLASVMLVALTAPSAAFAGVITQHYEFPEPILETVGDYVRVTMDGAWSHGSPGEPVLPMAPARILLPPGEVVVATDVVLGERIELASGVIVEPGQYQYPLSYDGPVARVEPAYAGRASFPDRLADEPKTGFFRGHSIASFALHPVEYAPTSGALAYYRTMDVTVTTARDAKAREAASVMLRGGDATDRTLARMVDNPAAGARYGGPVEITDGQQLLDLEPAYKYIIITTDTWDEYLTDFADFQTKRGLPAGIFLKSWILSNYDGVDAPQQIRRFIIDAYKTWGVEYVLLVGDTREENGIPHRGLYALNLDGGNTVGGTRYADSDIPGDVYYAALDGSWNDDGDGWWGEVGEADLYPDVGVGRICPNESWEIENFITKCERYQEAPIVADCDEVLMVGENLWAGTWGGTYKDEIRYGSSAYGYTTVGFPDRMNVNTLYEKEIGEWSPNALIALMDSGVNIVNHLGHCNEHHVMKLSPLDISLFTNDGTNHTLNFFYSQGCYGGSFDNKSVGGYYTYDCFTELMTTAQVGAAAAIANSRYGWGEIGGTNGSSQYFDREFFDAMFGEGIWALGDANNDSKSDVVWAIDYSANRWCFYQLNLFGDPAMHLWTDEPKELTVDHPVLVLTDQELMDVSVAGPAGAPIEDARVVVYTDDGSAYDTGVTDEFGAGSFRAAIPASGTLNVKVLAHDFVPYVTTIPVISSSESFLNLASELCDDDMTGASSGNGDGVPNAGETIELSVSVENLGGVTAVSAEGLLSCGSQYVTLTQAATSFGNVPAGATVQCQTPFVVTLASDTPDGEEITFSLAVSSSERPDWSHDFEFTVSAPIVEYAGHHLDDGPTGGNGNGCPEAEETVSVELMLSNTGSADATGLTATLSTIDPFVTVNDATLTATTVGSGETILLEGEYSLTLSPGCPGSHDVYLTVDIEADWGYSASTVFVFLTAGAGMSDDIEGDLAHWYHDVATPDAADAWHVETARVHSGSYSWKFGEEGYGGVYPQSSDGALSLDPMCIATGGELRFWDWLRAEEESPTTGWDCALVEMSTDLGATWEPIIPVGGYTHTKAWNAGNPIPNDTPCWSGSHDWREEVFDLSAYEGEIAMFRFRFASDEYVGMEGWYVDDLSITFAGGAPLAPDGERDLPAAFALRQNVPNPFNPITSIQYELPVDARVRIDVYNIAGRLVRTVLDEPRDAGYGEVVWDGRDASGERVASGVYMYRMSAGDFVSKKTMVLLK